MICWKWHLFFNDIKCKTIQLGKIIHIVFHDYGFYYNLTLRNQNERDFCKNDYLSNPAWHSQKRFLCNANIPCVCRGFVMKTIYIINNFYFNIYIYVLENIFNKSIFLCANMFLKFAQWDHWLPSSYHILSDLFSNKL